MSQDRPLTDEDFAAPLVHAGKSDEEILASFTIKPEAVALVRKQVETGFGKYSGLTSDEQERLLLDRLKQGLSDDELQDLGVAPAHVKVARLMLQGKTRDQACKIVYGSRT